MIDKKEKSKERKYTFTQRVGATGKKYKNISVLESQLTVEHKEFMYNQFMDSYANLPTDIQDRFFHNFLVNITRQAEVLKAKQDGTMINEDKSEQNKGWSAPQTSVIKSIHEIEEEKFINKLTRK